MILPENFQDSMKQLLGEEYAAFVESMKAGPQYGLRLNTLKITAEAFAAAAPFSVERIPWIPNGFFFQKEDQPARHPYYYAGLYYIQEPSAMTPASRLPVKPGDRVLDLCAAPGGKATELGERLRGRGVLVANDISSTRAKALLKNLELAGIPNLCVVSENPERLQAVYPEYFDKILVDAPCSGEGMFRRDSRLINAWQERGPAYYSEVQKTLLLQAASMLRPGGQMIYSTCTFAETENEAVIAHVLEQCPDLELQEMLPYAGFAAGRRGLEQCARIFPHKMAGEGHFIALLHKKESNSNNQKNVNYKAAGDAVPEAAKAFLADLKWDFSSGYFKQLQDKLYFLPEQVKLEKGLRYLRSGLYLGDIKKQRFEPSQALAMVLTSEQYPATISFDRQDIRTLKYLKGETVDISDYTDKAKGWQLVCVDGYPLGWGKAQNGMLKNKYYSGWRLQ